MRTRLLNVVLLAALVLAASRLWLFLREPPPALPPIATVATPPTAASTKSAQNAEAAESRPGAYDVIVARDLFSPTRGVVPPAPAVATKPAPKPQPAPKLTLFGVVIIDGEKTAFLQEGTQESRPRKVRENENFAGGVVNAIRPDGVTFLFAGSEINIPLRIPKDGAGAPSSRGQEAVSVSPRPQTPVALPRRQMPTGVPQGQLPAPARQVIAPARTPAVVPQVETGGEVFEEEEFPEESMPDGDLPGATEEEAGD